MNFQLMVLGEGNRYGGINGQLNIRRLNGTSYENLAKEMVAGRGFEPLTFRL
jgi:hypothetical protein